MARDAYDIIMLALNDLAHDSRVRREASALAAAGWRVLVIGAQRHGGALPDHQRIDGWDLRRVRYGQYGAGLRRPWRWLRHALQAAQIVRVLRRVRTRAHHAHDLPALLVVWVARIGQRPRARLVYDAHELYLFMSPSESAWASRWHALTRPLFMKIEGALARRADRVITLSDPQARLLARWYHLPRPAVIANAVDPADGETPGTGCMPDGALVHIGEITERGRALSETIRALALLPDGIALVFLGWGADQARLADLAQSLGVAGRVTFLPPVAPDEVAATVQRAGAALALQRPDSLNTRAGAPNKLYEAAAAGLPVVASNTCDLRRIVRRYGLGPVCDPLDPAAIAAAIRDVLDPAGQACYRASVYRARRELTWAREAEKLCAVYRALLETP